MSSRRFIPSIATCALLAAAGAAHAGSDGLFTTYGSEVDRGEVEVMLMNDFTRPSSIRRQRDGFGSYLSHMLEVEYGVSEQLALEGMVESFEDLASKERAFTGFRLEARYRLFRRHVPLNPMLYVEYEDLDARTRYKMEVSGWVDAPYTRPEEEGGRERIVESRLVLAEKAGPVSLAANAIFETDLHGGDTAFGYSLGAMWMHHGHGHGGEGAVQQESTWSCPMHPSVTAVRAGRCQECGMDLVADGPRADDVPSEGTGASSCACGRQMSGCACAHCLPRGNGACSCAHGGSFGFGAELYGGLGGRVPIVVEKRFRAIPDGRLVV